MAYSLIAVAVLYLRGWLAIRKTRPAQFNGQRLASFYGGLSVLWIAIDSPLDGYADVLLSAHMVEHLLLMSAVPPLLLYGLPVVPLLRSLPRFIVRSLLAPIFRSTVLRAFAHWMVTPLVAWLAMNLMFLGWHIPAAYDFALEHENWHAVEHLCFLASSTLFWWCILQPWPARPRPQAWELVLYLLGADVVNTILSAFLAFCGRPVYAFYLSRRSPFSISAVDDQALGAAIMWVFGSIAFLLPAMLITFRQLKFSGAEAKAAMI